MIEFSISSYENKIHMGDSPFNEDIKIIICFLGRP